jgi:diguanylate cyclase (GGDEF)-like protein
MALLKKNLWLIFYCLTVCATLLLGLVAYLKWESLYFKYQNSQENIIELMSNATHSLFDTHERLMDIIGISLINDRHYEEENIQGITQHVQPLLDSPAVSAFGITKANGDFLYGSTDPNPKNIQNILERPSSRASFVEALQSSRMVFGRTYFSTEVKRWVMPVRKSVHNAKGNPLFVMTTLLKPTHVYDALINTVRLKENLVVYVIRDSDFYPQYSSEATQDYAKAYNTPFPKTFVNAIYETIFDTYQLTPAVLKRDEVLVSFIYKHTDDQRYLASLKYDKQYNLWTVAHTKLQTIIRDFLQSFMWYIVVYLLAGCAFLTLFWLIANAENKRRNDLIYQATHDPLTLLPNRSFLRQVILEKIYKNAPPFSLLYIDMDHFKNINDSFGHQFGDYVLVEITKRIQDIAPKDALTVRQGGDEFLVLTSIVDKADLTALAHRLIDALSKPYSVHELNFHIGASIGIALYPEHGQSLDTLLRAADIALYESKKIKNSVHIFADLMQEGFLKNIKIEQELRSAISRNELFLVYQPQIDVQGTVCGVEVLVRWNSPSLGIIPPSLFIPLAEASGLMPKLGAFIVEEACSKMAAMQRECGHHFQVSINISVRQFMEPMFFEHLMQTVRDSQMHELSLTLEVTENIFIEDMHYIVPLLEQIRALGIQISMDDFGTGYSSLSMLRKLPIDELKIDKSFVDDMLQDEAAQKMVQNIIGIGKNFGMRLLAEGVETQEQKELLMRFGCDYFQGYYFSKPLALHELRTFFATQRFTCKI